MFDKPTATYPLGLELDGNLLRGALLGYTRGEAVIERLFTMPLELTEPVAACVLAPIKMLNPPLPRDRQRRALYVTGLAADETLIRSLDVKLTKIRDIDAVLTFQAEPLIPYSIDNAVVDRWVVGPIEDGTQLSVLSVRKDHLQNHLSFYESIMIEPEVISSYAAGLAIFVKHFSTVSGPTFVVHLARKTITCLLVEDGKALVCHAIPKGIDPLLEAAKDMSRDQIAALDFTSLSELMPPELGNAAETLRQALVRTVFALTKQAKGKEVSSIFFTGEGATLGNLAPCLAQVLKKELIEPTPIANAAFTSADLLTWAVPIGLAYSALPIPSSSEQINFRKGEFRYPNPWRRLTKPMSLYLASSLFLAFSIYLIGNTLLNYQDIRIKESYADLLGQMEKTHAEFELELQGKTPTSELLAMPPTTSLKAMTTDQLETRLNALEKQITSAPDTFPLQPDIPKVSDVLAWMSMHPKVSKVDPKTGERSGLIQIESLNYVMSKRPDKSKPTERYQAKIDMEFTSPDSKAAREFYDALAEPNEIVDPRTEVSWSAGQGKYRISFFLKDKTVYP